MTFCLRAGRTITPGSRLLRYRPSRSSLIAKCFTPLKQQFVSRVHTGSAATSTGDVKHGNSSNRTQSSFPQTNNDVTVWIESLERYLPQILGGKAHDTSSDGKYARGERLRSLLGLLQHARKTANIDLLAHFAFKLRRWDVVHYVISELLHHVGNPSSSPGPNCLPSNINWRQLGVRNWDSIGYLDRISSTKLKKIPEVPTSLQSQFVLDRVESQSVSEASRKVEREIMAEIWQSLGIFILEAADLTERRSLAAMEHVFQILGRLQHLDLIPHDVYNGAPSENSPRSRSRAGMPYLQSQIMHTLADASLEAKYKEDIASSVSAASRPPPRRYKIFRRELGPETWLEFVLCCCIENNFLREGLWILDQMQRRPRAWHLKSWAALLETTGAIDPSKIDYFDSWAECGQIETEHRRFMSRKPFSGMGERTVASEVVVSLIDGLLNGGLDPDGEPSSISKILAQIDSVRSILRTSNLYLGVGDISYFLARLIESKVVVADADPRSLGISLELVPEAINGDADNRAADCSALRGHSHGVSMLMLGLHSYALNAYASQGNVSAMIDIFERLIGVLDFRKILEMRRLGLDEKYLINADEVKSAEELRRQIFGKDELDDDNLELLCTLLSWPISLSRLLDALTDSKSFRLGRWLLRAKSDDRPLIPTDKFSDAMLAPALIRFAAATKDNDLFKLITASLGVPLQREILKAMITYMASALDWDNAVKLLNYLLNKHNCNWGAANITTVAAMIIRLDHQSSTRTSIMRPKERKANLERAKDVLIKLLGGGFNRPANPAEPYSYQERELYQIYRVLNSLPNPGSLAEVCRLAKLQWAHTYNPRELIYAPAFNHILSAVVDTQGSLAGKHLWDLWCINPFSRDAEQIRAGPNAIFQTWDDFIKAENTESWGESQEGKIVLPNLDTVRIIAMRAIDEQKTLWGSDSSGHSLSATTADNNLLGLLRWCVKMFEQFGLTEHEINREVEGHLARIKAENSNQPGFPIHSHATPQKLH
ncbi:hypothetical protein VTO42DRAFT_4753 [Malbranchea cinnamomea]